MVNQTEVSALSAVYKKMDDTGREEMVKMADKFLAVQKIVEKGKSSGSEHLLKRRRKKR